MLIQFTIKHCTTAEQLAVALWNCTARELLPDEATPDGNGGWVYAGTDYAVRRVPADAGVVLVHRTVHELQHNSCTRGTACGWVLDTDGGWIADRFGNLGARECARALARL